MISSISTCPKCKTLILDDTLICPQCHHVLQEGADHVADVYTSSDDRYDGSNEIACRDCKAMNRKGLVRCWQCGAFMQEDMEKVYQEMLLRPAAIIEDDDLEIQEITAKTQQSDATAIPSLDEDEDDDDFELDVSFDMVEAEENWFPDSNHDAPAFDDDEEEAESAPVAKLEPEVEEEEDLLKLAEKEEKELSRQKSRKKKAAPKNTFLIQGPCGDCKIRVQRYHQGEIGQCPKCTLPFLVPIIDKPKSKKAEKETKKEPLPEKLKIEGVHWHEIAIAKFKPKANALKGKGETPDLIRWNDELIFVWPKQKGVKGNAAKQAETVRQNVAEHLQSGKPMQALPTDRFEVLPKGQLSQLFLVQPPYDNNFTNGEQVFGPGVLAIELPPAPVIAAETQHPSLTQTKPGKKPKKPKKPAPPKEPPTRCVVLTLSQYRKVQMWLAEILDQSDFLKMDGIPLQTQTATHTCALAEHEFESLELPEYYQADPALHVVEVGWLCQCGEVAMCEEHRAEQKFGGKKPAGLTKAKCPKCEQKFGKNPLFHLKSVVAPEPEKTEEEKLKEKQAAEGESDEGGTKEEAKSKFSLGGLLKKKPKGEQPEKTSDKKALKKEKTKTPEVSTANSDTTEAKSKTEEKPKKSMFGGLFKGKAKKNKDEKADAIPPEAKAADNSDETPADDTKST
ncbi:hypothetical protein [Rubinisphaera italica]|uniref:Uncharacterized protein n=1 Tax=Rubinisphaera italica TaxID=2527969 RepID=A0A5C5XIK8_9PLAN|nr:hypothetical protein [Rubinisphaera italica]TWT62191.1 hypothetical protein Pan54_29320 [Rubinisphaera italica]